MLCSGKEANWRQVCRRPRSVRVCHTSPIHRPVWGDKASLPRPNNMKMYRSPYPRPTRLSRLAQNKVHGEAQRAGKGPWRAGGRGARHLPGTVNGAWLSLHVWSGKYPTSADADYVQSCGLAGTSPFTLMNSQLTWVGPWPPWPILVAAAVGVTWREAGKCPLVNAVLMAADDAGCDALQLQPYCATGTSNSRV